MAKLIYSYLIAGNNGNLISCYWWSQLLKIVSCLVFVDKLFAYLMTVMTTTSLKIIC